MAFMYICGVVSICGIAALVWLHYDEHRFNVQ